MNTAEFLTASGLILALVIRFTVDAVRAGRAANASAAEADAAVARMQADMAALDARIDKLRAANAAHREQV